MSNKHEKKYRYDYGDNYSPSSNKKQVDENTVDIYSNSKKKSTKLSKKKKIINISIFALSTIFAMLGGFMLYANSKLDLINYDEPPQINNTDDDESGDLSKNGFLLKDPKVLNVMLFGIDDQSVGDSGRTDSMLLLSIDNRRKKVKITSIMRDLWVPIPGHKSQKINAAFAIGGSKLAVETVERNFGINIDRYATVSFNGFAKVVDALDGIDMELTLDEIEMINGLEEVMEIKAPKKLEYREGVHHLCGVQALNHSRDRSSGGDDYGRTKRQREVLSTIISKAKTASLPQIGAILTESLPNVTTNFTKGEISNLASKSLRYLNYEVAEYRVPEDNMFTNQTIDGQAALVLDSFEKSRENLAKFLYEDSLTKIK